MQIPESFQAKASRQFGEAGKAWVRELPAILDRCRKAWRLTVCRPIEELSINFVCLCMSETYGDTVLKIQGPHSERYTEIEALELFDGRHCCRIVALDLRAAAMLLERVRPGMCLRKLPERSDQLRIGAEMLRSVPRAVSAGHKLPTYSQWIERAAANMDRGGAPDTLRALLQTARDSYEAIDADHLPQRLLHGDLHHDNILQAGPDAWVAIDPQGVIGPAILESGRFIQNHALWGEGPIDTEEVFDTVQYIADALGETWDRIAKALFILHALSVCWDWEMNKDPETIERQELQCREILRMIGNR